MGALSSKTLADLEKPGARNLIRTELINGFNNVLGDNSVSGNLHHRIRHPISRMETTAPSADEIMVLTARGVRERRPATDVRSHNFRQSGFLAASELRRIRQRHEQFIRSLAARLAIFLRLEFSLSARQGSH